jgi:hypothetical protein
VSTQTQTGPAPEMWGAAEAASHLGVRQSNLRTLVGLPEPAQRVRATSLWFADDIRRLKRERDARASRVPASGQGRKP